MSVQDLKDHATSGFFYQSQTVSIPAEPQILYVFWMKCGKNKLPVSISHNIRSCRDAEIHQDEREHEARVPRSARLTLEQR